MYCVIGGQGGKGGGPFPGRSKKLSSPDQQLIYYCFPLQLDGRQKAAKKLAFLWCKKSKILAAFGGTWENFPVLSHFPPLSPSERLTLFPPWGSKNRSPPPPPPAKICLTPSQLPTPRPPMYCVLTKNRSLNMAKRIFWKVVLCFRLGIFEESSVDSWHLAQLTNGMSTVTLCSWVSFPGNQDPLWLPQGEQMK